MYTLRAALLLALINLSLAIRLQKNGNVDGKGYNFMCKLKGTIIQPQGDPLEDHDCSSAGALPQSGDADIIPRVHPAFKHDNKKRTIRTKWRLSRKVLQFVMFIEFTGKNNAKSALCYQFQIPQNMSKLKRGTRTIDCTYVKTGEDRAGGDVNFTIIQAKTALKTTIPEAKTIYEHPSTTEAPVGCYNWHPKRFIAQPGNTSVRITWSPPIELSGLEISLYDVDNRETVQNKAFMSWEKHITEHTFDNVTAGRYTARIKPKGCKDCPDYNFNGGCFINPEESEQFTAPNTQEAKTIYQHPSTTEAPVGCYNWHPKRFIAQPGNTSVRITWSPPFELSGLEISLYDVDNRETVQNKAFMSWEKHITEHTFDNVTAGRYTARIKPTGCKDCPYYNFNGGCFINPEESEQFTAPNTQVSKTMSPVVVFTKHEAQDHSTVYIMAGVTGLALSFAVVIIFVCLSRDRSKKLPNQPNTYPHPVATWTANSAIRPRIVILYGVDHVYHIDAVLSFASLLRKLLDAEVVVERQQGRASTCNTAEWVTMSLQPPTTVIVIASEALYQLSCHQDVRRRDFISRTTGDMFAKYGPLGLNYLQTQSCSSKLHSQTVLLVSFGYGHGDTSLVNLMASFRLLFKGVYFKVTEKNTGTRSQNIADLLRCLSVDGSIPAVAKNMEEMEEFLANVERMDEHIQENGSAWWENVTDSSSYTSWATYSRSSPVLGDLAIDTETFSVSSEVTASSAVTVSVFCKRCHVSSCHTLPSGVSNGDTRRSRSRLDEVLDSSCLTLHLPDDDCDVFTADVAGVSESMALLPTLETLYIEDLETSLEYGSDIQTPASRYNETGSRSSSVSIQVGGREC